MPWEVNMDDREKPGETIISTIQPINQEPIVNTFSSSTASGDIMEGVIQALEGAGYKLEPKRVRVMKEILDNSKEWGAGVRVGFSLNPETGVSTNFERTPSKQTKTLVDITFEVTKSED
jgi:hypothetical protein